MAAETPSNPSGVEPSEDDLDSSIHGFTEGNVTVIEKHAPNDGSDSGVEDSFDLLGRKNSNTMLQDLKDSGSETSSTSSRPSTSSKKKVSMQTPVKTPVAKKPPAKKPCTPRPSTLKTSAPVTPKPKPQDKPSDKTRPRVQRSASTTRTPVITPTDDGRWPSNNKNAMTRSFRATSVTQDTKEVKKDKYATLPRRRRERSADNVKEVIREPRTNLRKQLSRESTPARSLPPCPTKKKTRIFAETHCQTTLTLPDLARLVDSGTLLERGERIEVSVQTDQDPLKEQIKQLQQELATTKQEKQTLQNELHRTDDTILELETRFEAATQVITKQETEISELHAFCRSLQTELSASRSARHELESAQQELEHEGRELQEFLAAEKWALCEALAEAEARGAAAAAERARLRMDALALETRSRDLLLAQGAAVSGAAVALSGLAHRLDTLTGKLAAAYNISEQQLDEDIYHNEAYNPDTPDSPQENEEISFLSAVISAIRNTVSENTDSEADTLLDSETEPCLMMENVLEDVIHVDTHSHNLVSEPGASASSLVDQVIEADNLLTRLLKVLRVIQKVQDTEAATLKADLQQHRRHVERLSEDVCELSTACSKQGHGVNGDLVGVNGDLVKRLQETHSVVDAALEKLSECTEEQPENSSLTELQKTLEEAKISCRPEISLNPSDSNANANQASLIAA